MFCDISPRGLYVLRIPVLGYIYNNKAFDPRYTYAKLHLKRSVARLRGCLFRRGHQLSVCLQERKRKSLKRQVITSMQKNCTSPHFALAGKTSVPQSMVPMVQ